LTSSEKPQIVINEEINLKS